MNEAPVSPARYARDRPKDCRYCYYWGGRKKKCLLGGEQDCFYLIRGDGKPKSRCDGCPYGRASPCIGWCTVDVMDAVFKRKKPEPTGPGKEASADGDQGREE